jgi:hypothetical protein
LVVIAILQDVWIAQRPWMESIPKLIIPITLLTLALSKNKSEILHKIIVLILLTVFIGSMAVEDYVIQ